MNLIERLAANGPVVTDGAWGTEMQARGLAPGECPDAWNLAHPERVEEVARAYVEAGSQVILTNTFRANRVALAGTGLEDRIAEINRAGVAISLRAAGGNASVFASMGPGGKMLMTGEVTASALREAFAEQARALAAAGAAALVVETMADLEECKLALAAALETGLPVVASMVFDAGKKKDRTMMGGTPEQVARELEEAGAHAIGANCGCGVEGYIEICRRMRAVTSRPLWIKANAGLPELIEGKPVYRMTAREYGAFAPMLAAAGASFIGGCCGTGPEFIRAIRGRLTPCA
ncbi:MAG: homocysteine S-methyltransferase family protein [Bryobacteraceae bacterium]